eukprot:CAMPEP_0118876236 /NCGR_PEP_ID=MMETSP1163-20130328/17017_1 /TAXON_ID=124430 /ORGANISM="Phaeomonas parva, Strain CCMP2877" /LENGTH=113 /DNA_ID=CAMNT_0006811833 /DNA_START=283 /DNA_END=621 /DNA_ORIENTATION=+
MADLQFKVTVPPARPQRLRLPRGATLGELRAKIEDAFGAPAAQQVLLSGYPPAPVQPAGGVSTPLIEVFPSGREAITVQLQEGGAAAAAAAPPPAAAAAAAAAPATAQIQKVP